MIDTPNTNIPNHWLLEHFHYPNNPSEEIIWWKIVDTRSKLWWILKITITLWTLLLIAWGLYLLWTSVDWTTWHSRDLETIHKIKELHKDIKNLTLQFSQTINLQIPKATPKKNTIYEKLWTNDDILNIELIISRLSELENIIYWWDQKDNLKKTQWYTKTLDIKKNYLKIVETLREFMWKEFSLFNFLSAIWNWESDANPNARSSTWVTWLSWVTVGTARAFWIWTNLSNNAIRRMLKVPKTSLKISVLKIEYIANFFNKREIKSEDPYRDICFSYNTWEQNWMAIYKIQTAMQQWKDEIVYVIDKKRSMSFQWLQAFKDTMETTSPWITNSMSTELFYSIFEEFIWWKYKYDKTSEAIRHYLRVMLIYYKQWIPKDDKGIRLLNNFLRFTNWIQENKNLKQQTLPFLTKK